MKTITAIGVFGMLVAGLQLWTAFSMMVWMSRGSDWKILVDFNVIGEGRLELFLIPFVAVCNLVMLVIVAIEWARERRK